MKNIYIKTIYGCDGVDHNELLGLIHSSFEERLSQGLHFSCSSATLKEIEKYLEKSYSFLAFQDKALIGYLRLVECFDKKGRKYAYHGPIAISPSFKGCGVGSMLFRFCEEKAKEMNIDYVESDTAVQALSSVEYHKKNGFKIVGMASHPFTNYYSYVFRKPYVYNPIICNEFLCMVRFQLAKIKCKSILKESGEYTFFGKILNKVINI